MPFSSYLFCHNIHTLHVYDLYGFAKNNDEIVCGCSSAQYNNKLTYLEVFQTNVFLAVNFFIISIHTCYAIPSSKLSSLFLYYKLTSCV
jgi:hypothetical protein